jgi:hypothetical protein
MINIRKRWQFVKKHRFCDFERFKQPSKEVLEVVESDITSTKSKLSHKLEQIGFEIQTSFLDKDITEN